MSARRGLPAAIAAALCIAVAPEGARGDDRNGAEDEILVRSVEPARVKRTAGREKECRKRLYGLICAYPVSTAPLDTGCAFLYHAYPLSGPFDKAVFDSIGSKVSAFLSGYGAARTISVEQLDSCLSGGSGGCDGFRYLVTPLGTASMSKKKSVGIDRFVKLDTAGNFVPTRSSSTLTSVETEQRIRFVAIDLQLKTVVFSGRIVKKTSSVRALDKEITGRPSPAGGKKDAGANESAYETAEKIVRKLRIAFTG